MSGGESFIPSIKPDISGDSYHDLKSLNRLRELGQKDKSSALAAAARQFESHFLKTLIKSMREANEALGENELFDSENADFYQEMYDEQLAATLSSKNSLGLADLMIKQLSGLAPSAPNRNAAMDTRSATQNAKEVNTSSDNSVRELPIKPSPTTTPSTTRASHENAIKFNPTPETAASSPIEPLAFIQKVLPHAERAAKALGVPTETILAQTALETGWGRASGAADGTHHYFGVKAGNQWQGEATVKSTIEFEQGVPKKSVERFRAYPNIESAFDDYVQFLKTSPRYQEALAHDGSAKRFAQGLQSGGYATDPSYADKIMRIQHGEFFNNVLKEARNLLSTKK